MGIKAAMTAMPPEKWNRPNTTIAKEYSCSHTMVGRIRKSLGIPPYIRKDRIDWERHAELLASDMLDTDVATIIGCDRSSVTVKRKEPLVVQKPKTPSKDVAPPGPTINRIICGNRVGRTEIEESVQMLSEIQRSRRMPDPLFLKVKNSLKKALGEMALVTGSGKMTPLPPVSVETGDKGTLRMKVMFSVPKNVKTRNAINRVIRRHISGGEILIDAMTRIHQAQSSRTSPDPALDELIETLRLARDKMADVIMDFVRQEG